MKRTGVMLAVLVGALLLADEPAEAVPPVTSESPGCGTPRFYLPESGRRGALPGSFPVRGPAGALFGRTLDDVEEQLVWWTVPMSDGVRVRIHRLLLPVLQDVERNLAIEAAAGRHYEALAGQTWGFNARTSVSHEAVSYHGLGAAIDINASANPYRLDGTLVTDMPDWYVRAWERAGMCWGGAWRSVKDPMHFSWVGPGPSPSYSSLPLPHPPLTAAASFRMKAGDHPVVFGRNDNRQFVLDASGDGAPDVAHLRPWRGADHVLELAISQRGYSECAVWRWWLGEIPDGEPAFADTQGMGRPDLLFLDETGPTLSLARYSVSEGYERVADIPTQAPTGGRYVFGDIDRDGAEDLWVLTPATAGTDITVWSAASGYTEIVDAGTLPLTVPESARLATADRDVDGRDGLLMIEPTEAGSQVSVVSSADLGAVAEVVSGPTYGADDELGFEDYDGDGRPDFQVFGPDGLEVWLGNQAMSGYSPSSWFLPAGFECDDDTLPYFHEGEFADDDDSEFQHDIEWLASRGITRGCNPPFDDRFCPDDRVTRGQMAAFLRRAFRLPDGDAGFVDTSSSVFEADIAALAEAGITRGCNPPANDRFCPDDLVTRGQMAAFLTRAFGLAAAPSPFTDDDGSVFETDISALAASGITRGCNPPANDRFCPDRTVTRGEMAAFLHRAEAMLPP